MGASLPRKNGFSQPLARKFPGQANREFSRIDQANQIAEIVEIREIVRSTLDAIAPVLLWIQQIRFNTPPTIRRTSVYPIAKPARADNGCAEGDRLQMALVLRKPLEK